MVPNIFLVGYRCSGKTSVGRYLAQRLQLAFVDSDHRVVQAAGVTIEQLVSAHGWDHFRELEKRVLSEICLKSGQVVATGGGVVLDPENVTAMKASGRVIWLRVRPDTVCRRMLKDSESSTSRPALTDLDPVREIEETLALREPLYRAAGGLAFDSDDRGIEELAEKIINALKTI